MPTVDLPGMRSMRTDSACMARQRSSASPVTLEYLTPASGLNSYVVTTGPGWIWTTVPSTANSRHFSSSSRAPSMSSRSSIFRSPRGASSSAYGGSVNAPFLRSIALSGSGSGSEGYLATGGGFLIGGGVGLVAAAFKAAAAALTTAAVFEREGGEGGEGIEGSFEGALCLAATSG